MKIRGNRAPIGAARSSSRRLGMLLPLSLAVFAYVALVRAADPPAADSEFSATQEQEDWTQRLIAADAAVKEERAKQPVDAMRLAHALSDLGAAQIGSRNYDAAEIAFLEALQLLDRASNNPGAREYLPALEGLGIALARDGRHPQAIPQLERALQVAHRSYGLLDPRQERIRVQLATSLVAVGRPADGERHIKYLQTIGERTHGPRDPALSPILCRMAQWYADSRNYFFARARYREAIDLVEQTLGRKHVALVEPLRGLARSYMDEANHPPREKTLEPEVQASGNWDLPDRLQNPRTLSGDGERALKRAVAILEGDSSSDPQVLVDTLLELGDWFQIKHQPKRALEHYKHAWELAKQHGRTQDVLAFPYRVYYSVPISSVRNSALPDELIDLKYVRVQFTVTPDGAVENPQVSERTASSRLASQTLRAVEAARFRPRFVDGEPTATQAVSLTQSFRVRKEADPADESSS